MENPSVQTAVVPHSYCSVFVKPFTLLRTKTDKNAQKLRFPKTLFNVDIHKNGSFWKRCGSMERTKTDKNKNTATATTTYFIHFSPKSTLNSKKAKTYEMEYILPAFLIKLLATINFMAEININALAPLRGVTRT